MIYQVKRPTAVLKGCETQLFHYARWDEKKVEVVKEIGVIKDRNLKNMLEKETTDYS